MNFHKILLYFETLTMNVRSLCLKFVFAVWLTSLAPCLWAQDGLRGALSQSSFAAPLEQRLAVADLDGDNKADGAVLLDSKWLGPRSNFRIQLHLTGRPNTELTFESTERALTVTAWDIDHDGDTDLVVEEAFTHKPLYVWINEGHGDFHEGRVQDYPSLALGTDIKLQSPSNQRDDLALSVPSQRGFETTILTVPLLGRPPSANKLQIFSMASLAASRPGRPDSSRAPPLA